MFLFYSYLFEFSRLEGLIFLLFIFVLILTWIRIFFIKVFLNRFYCICLFLFIVIVLNSLICFSVNLLFLIMILIFISFFSFCLVLYGYGVSVEICFIIPFKLLADLCLMLYFGCNIFLVGYVEVEVLELKVNLIYMDLFLFISFCIYSLCGVFGFWLYWAMDGSYFVSSYLHSVGFIMIGVILFFKIYYLGLLWSGVVDGFLGVYYLVLMFYFSFILFLIFFLCVRKVKRGYGYFSCSSVCFVYLILIYSPYIGLIYFCLSSFLKIFFFELMGLLGKGGLGSDDRIFYDIFLYFGFTICMNFTIYGFSLYLYFYFDIYCECIFWIKGLCGIGVGDLFRCIFYLKFFSLVVFMIRFIGGFVGFSFELFNMKLFFMLLVILDLVYVIVIYFFMIYIFLLNFYLFGVLFLFGIVVNLYYGVCFRGFRVIDLEIFVRILLRRVFNWFFFCMCMEVVNFWFGLIMLYSQVIIERLFREGVVVGVFSFLIFSFTFLI